MKKESKYEISKGKVFKQTFFIWTFLGLHIIGNYFLSPIFIEDGKLIGVILLNAIFLTFNIHSERSASRDLEQLTELNVFEKIGEKKGTKYKLWLGG